MSRGIVVAVLMSAVMVFVAASPLVVGDLHQITKGNQGPRASAMTWEYVPVALGTWTGHIVNDGLRSVVIEVCDNTTGTMDVIMHQRIRFAAYNAYPSGTVDTATVAMSPTHKYSITLTPNGPKNSSCTIEDVFVLPTSPVAGFQVTINQMNVGVAAFWSHDPDGTIVSYDWDFGDGGIGTGETTMHEYSIPGTYTITLVVTDNDGLTGKASEDVSVSVPNPGAYGWSDPASIGAPMDEMYSKPSVSMNELGQAIAGWSSMQGSEWQVWVNMYEPGVGWKTPEPIGPASPWSSSPAVGIDIKGNCTVAWTFGNTIYTKRYVPAFGGWESAVVITDAEQYPSGLTLAVDAAGQAVLAWEAQVDLHWGIMACARDMYNHWSAPTLIENSSGQADNPCAAISDVGYAVVVFSIYGDSRSDIWANTYAFGIWTGWLGERLIEDLDQYSYTPRVSMDGWGNAYVVWDYMTAVDYVYTNTVYAARCVNLVWQGAEMIESEPSSGMTSPDVYAYGNGNAAVVWTTGTGQLPTCEIRTSSYHDGFGWSSLEVIGSGGLVSYPSVAVDSSGGTFVCWSQSDGLGNPDGFVIMSNHLTQGLGWSAPQTIMWLQNTSGPSVAAGPSDTAVMVWDDYGPPARVLACDYTIQMPVVDAGPTQYLWGQDVVQFDGSGSYSDVGIVSYLWTWTAGNGSSKSLTGMTPWCPSEWFFSYGNYTVTLTATDGAGRIGTDTVSIVFGFRIYDIDPKGAQGIITSSDGYYKLRIENHGMTSFEWTIIDGSLTIPPYDVFHATVTFSSEYELLVSDPFWMTGGRYYQSEYIPNGPPGSYMTIFAFFVPTP